MGQAEAVRLEQVQRGDVLVNLGSGKEYAVVEVQATREEHGHVTRHPHVGIVGIRNGKRFGPWRSIRPGELHRWALVMGAKAVPAGSWFTSIQRAEAR